MTRLGGAAAIAATILLLTACATGPTGNTTSVASTSPSASPTATPAPSWPQALIDTSCEELVPQAVVDATFGVPLAAGATDPARALFGTFYQTASEYAGGLSCEWGAIDPAAPTEDRNGSGGPDNWLAVAVDIVPRAAGVAERIASDLNGSVPTADPTGACDFGLCTADMLIGEYWVNVVAVSYADSYLPPTAAQQALFDQVAAVVGGLGESAEPMLPPESAAWASECAQIVSTETLESALDLTSPTWEPSFSYRSSNLAYGAVLVAGGQTCGFGGAESGRTGSINTLPGAGPAFAESLALARTAPEVSVVEIDGLPVDSAFVRVNPLVTDRAELELNLRGTWVTITVGGASMLGDGSLTATERVIALATAMAAA
ncbi:hypothetical protein SAMN06295974_0312 [Plantibacter flavus]|uniref:Uncharacterized protein n=1 Tax=Plantibacter flavus TaxID=150123 RepID=A0A3N2C0Q0_9MICO|nr:hypothetical protein [Plantibacter flavus]ROR81089.1 hypothetical protein EDD42_1139 [Plantibacter flavus]SMG07795.1 hypothetical protein SAMN06295974_0312 [Plantibacter flavus]